MEGGERKEGRREVEEEGKSLPYRKFLDLSLVLEAIKLLGADPILDVDSVFLNNS